MSYNSQRVPSFAAYGGVPQDAAYGGIPTEEAYRLAREKKEHEEKGKTDTPFYSQSLENVEEQTKSTNDVWENIKKWGNSFAKATEAGSVGFTSGLTLGNFDEGAGLLTASLTGNSGNYEAGRDAVRQLQNNLRKEYPILYNSAEIIGAATSPIKFFKTPKTAFLNRHDKNRWYNVLMDTAIGTVGYSDTLDLDEISRNLFLIGLGNAGGTFLSNRMLGRGGGIAARTAYNVGGNLSSNLLSYIFNDESE